MNSPIFDPAHAEPEADKAISAPLKKAKTGDLAEDFAPDPVPLSTHASLTKIPLDSKEAEQKKDLSDFLSSAFVKMNPDNQALVKATFADSDSVIRHANRILKLPKSVDWTTVIEALAMYKPEVYANARKAIFVALDLIELKPGGGGLGTLAIKDDSISGRPGFSKLTQTHPGLEPHANMDRRHITAWHTILAFAQKAFREIPHDAIKGLLLEALSKANSAIALEADELIKKLGDEAFGTIGKEMGTLLIKWLYIANSNPSNLWMGNAADNRSFSGFSVYLRKSIGSWTNEEHAKAAAKTWGEQAKRDDLSKRGILIYGGAHRLLAAKLAWFRRDKAVPDDAVLPIEEIKDVGLQIVALLEIDLLPNVTNPKSMDDLPDLDTHGGIFSYVFNPAYKLDGEELKRILNWFATYPDSYAVPK